MARRMSMGSRLTPLSDHNSRPSFRSETPLKDRHVLLDEWRRQTRSRERSNETTSSSKRQRMQEAPRLPPSAQQQLPVPPPQVHSAEDGLTALERFRMRKQMRQQQSSTSMDESFSNSQNSTSICYDDSDEVSTLSTRLAATPSGRHRLGGGARRKTMVAMRPSTSLLSQESENNLNSSNYRTSSSQLSQSQTGTLSQLTTESDVVGTTTKTEPIINTVESAGLKSQIHEMQQRIDSLEKEKIELSMTKAPLEARFRQKEDAWIKEQNSLIQEIDSLKADSRKANELYRDLQLKYEAYDEEVKKLRFQVLKASSAHSNHSTRGSMLGTQWSRPLQSDREVTELKEQLRCAKEDLDMTRLEKVSIEKELHGTKVELDSISRNYDELLNEYDEVAKSSSDNRDAEIQLDTLKAEHMATSAQLNAVCVDLAKTRATAEAKLDEMEGAHKKEIEQLHFEMSVLKTRAGKISQLDSSSDMSEEEDEAVLKARIEERDRRIADLEAVVLKGEEIRRQMHNRIQELRGNIRVFVRTRPFLPSDGQSDDPAIDVSPDGESLSIVDPRSSADHGFKFDKVFPPSSGQDQVFGEVADFVQSALDGYQVCLFSYGQTGSGKTHTMQGFGNGAMRGIIPRAVEQILEQARAMQGQKWDFKLSASFLEIYNENLKDLLICMSGDKATSKNPPKLTIKRTREGKTYVDGLTAVPIETRDADKGMTQLDTLMGVAARARSVASTKMNAQSSRSHSVFMLNIYGTNDDSGAIVHGSLNLCDLAGSERLDRSGASADAKRLKETQSINSSLSCLGNVFNALAQGAGHIPYRNSKLTYLLQDCLSGDGKALMFVNLSPTTASSNESLCSLRFAQRVNQVELGKPTKHIQYQR